MILMEVKWQFLMGMEPGPQSKKMFLEALFPIMIEKNVMSREQKGQSRYEIIQDILRCWLKWNFGK